MAYTSVDCWTGASNSNWNNTGNWKPIAGDKRAQYPADPGNTKHAVFHPSYIQRYGVNVGDSGFNDTQRQFKGHLAIGVGTEDNPLVISNYVNAAKGVYSNQADKWFVLGGTLNTDNNNTDYYPATDAVVKFSGGSYGPWQAGTKIGTSDGAHYGHLILDGETVKTTFTFGKADANAFIMYSGRLTSTNSDVVCNGQMRIAVATSATGVVDKKDGDWTIGSTDAGRLYLGHAPGTRAEFYHRGGSLIASSYICIGAFDSSDTTKSGYAYFELDGGMVSNKSQTVIISDKPGTTSDKAVLRVKNGIFAANANLNVGASYSGELIIEGGEVDVSRGKVQVAGGDVGEDSALVLSNGVLKTRSIYPMGGTANATILLDGGTLKAASGGTEANFIPSDSRFAVNVGDRGAIIDAGGQTILIPRPLNALAGTSGGLTVTGGGAATFSAMGDIAGAFSVGENTTLHWFDQDNAVSTTCAISSLALGAGSTIYIDADATGHDALPATVTTTATTANPAKVKLILSSIPAPTETFSLFEVDDADKIMVEAETTAGATLEVAKTYESGVVRYAILAREYTWNDGTTGANWSATGKWLLDNVAATWADNNIAVFATAGDSVAVDSDVTAVKLDFQADATVAAGGGTLTVPSVSVVPSVSATISAPTAGTLEKIGTGTLALGAARSAATTVAEGTLAFTAGNDAIAVANLTLGTDPEKPVVFDYGGNTLSGNLTDYLTAGMDITLTNGTFSTTQDSAWFGYTTDSARVIPPKSLTIAKDAVLTTTTRLRWNASDTAGVDTTNAVNIAGGQFVSAGGGNTWIMQNSRCGTLYFNVTDGGLLQFGDEVYALPCRDNTTVSDTPALYFNVTGSTFRVGGGKSFRFGYDSGNKEPLNVTGVFAATNSTIDIAYGLYIGNDAETKTSGSYTADFESCVITAREIRVYKDRMQNAVRFNGTRLVVGADSGVIKTASAFETMGEGGTAVKPITIDAGGLILDTNGKGCTLEADPQGTGAFTKIGTGTLTVNRNQTSTADFICEEGETVLAAGLTMTRPVTVKDGATFTVEATSQATVASLTLEAGSTLNINTPLFNGAPFAVGTLTLPAEGKATLKINGGGTLPCRRYAVLSKAGIVAGDFANLELSVSGVSASFSVEDGTLYVDVKGDNEYVWTGLGDGESFSVGANWLGGVPPTGANLYIGVASASALVCDIADFAPQSITFPADSAAVTINGAQAMSGVAAVTNLSTTVSHTINVPVYFAGNIQVKQAAMAEKGDLTKAHVTFAGGAHAAQDHAIENGSSSAVYSRCMFGDYYLYPTAENPWTASNQGSSKRNCLADNSTLHVPYAGALHELYIGTGAVVTNGVVALPEGKRLSYQNKGMYVIADEFTVSGSGKKDGYAGHSAGTNASNVFKIEKATCTKTDGYTFYFAESDVASHGTYYFGAGGINFGSGKGYFGIGKNSDGDAQTIRPWYGDFTIGTGAGNTDGYDMYMFRDVTFNTDDDNGVGRTITVDARLRFDATPTFTVAGSGKVLVNSAANNKVQPPVTVTDTATLAMKPGASLTTSNITVNANATLEVAESGTLAPGCDLSLADGAILGFNFTDRKRAPLIDLTGKEVFFGSQKSICVKITGERPWQGEHQLTSGGVFSDSNNVTLNTTWSGITLLIKEDGNLYIKVARGAMVLVK